MNPQESAPDDGLPPLRDVIASLDLQARRSLGQNFILDLNLTRRIARLAAPLDDLTVVEIGPGPGGLTRALLMEGAARVVAIERDGRCLPALQAISDAYPGRLTIVHGDALETDISRYVSPGQPAAIIANLPYNVATLLLVGWLEADVWPPWWSRMVLMFQKEVAQRLVAEPNSKAYGRLSVLTQYRAVPRIRMSLPPQAFTPAPKVESCVVEIVPRALPIPPCPIKGLARITAAGFGQRRKMLRSSLQTITPFAELLLQRAGIDPQRRAETLSVAEFAYLATALETPAG
jgi:16S rRNA (adenine1518-N6/adenine1519-N6)-dimethyltransferase